MSKLFPRLFSPVKLRSKTLRNRIVFGAHTANMSEAGLPGPRHIAYYVERALGVRWLLDVSVAQWRGDGALVLDHDSGGTTFVEADNLVTATTNVAADDVARELAAAGVAFRQIGDCAAPRQAPYAFYEGRMAGLEI